MGSSTALHLARRGYRDITILDVFPIPSDNSAGNDLNKARLAGSRVSVSCVLVCLRVFVS
jgi:glycine/D-amino acid oxidase-like deaminating enzyme